MPAPIIDYLYVITTETCSYCNTQAKFAFKNGKFCCSQFQTSCPAIKKKNSDGLINMHKTNPNHYKIKYDNLPEASKEKMAWRRGKNAISDNRVKSTKPFSIKNLVQENIKEYKCERCNITSWNNESIKLELDHIDGNRHNNDLQNLRLLCPNCHSQTPTFRGRNINKGTTKIDDQTFLEELKKSTSIRDCLISLKLAPKGGNYNRAYNLVYKHNITHLMKSK